MKNPGSLIVKFPSTNNGFGIGGWQQNGRILVFLLFQNAGIIVHDQFTWLVVSTLDFILCFRFVDIQNNATETIVFVFEEQCIILRVVARTLYLFLKFVYNG